MCGTPLLYRYHHATLARKHASMPNATTYYDTQEPTNVYDMPQPKPPQTTPVSPTSPSASPITPSTPSWYTACSLSRVSTLSFHTPSSFSTLSLTWQAYTSPSAPTTPTLLTAPPVSSPISFNHITHSSQQIKYHPLIYQKSKIGSNPTQHSLAAITFQKSTSKLPSPVISSEQNSYHPLLFMRPSTTTANSNSTHHQPSNHVSHTCEKMDKL